MPNLEKLMVDIKKNVYAMASVDGKSAEITLYGDIVEQVPTDWWGDPIEGQYITLNEFLNDLDAVSNCKELLIRMNSYGGDAGVSNLIHNRLREMSEKGTKLTCIVDGVAMSGGSLIMCACDTVQVYPSSLVMIHKGWVFLFGGYNADDMRQMATQNDAWDNMQIEIYKRKTGMTDTVLRHMMSETTYMTGREAVDKGFADVLLESGGSAKVAASADGRYLFVSGRKMHLCPGMFAPDTIPTATSEAETAAAPAAPTASVEANINEPATPGEGGIPMTLEELRSQHPELVEQIETAAAATAVEAERNRLKGIDEVAMLIDSELVAEARFGKTACNAQELTYRAAQKAATSGGSFLGHLATDAKAAAAASVPAAPAPLTPKADDDSPEAMKAAAKKAAEAYLKTKEGK